jgi:hypothetical protein
VKTNPELCFVVKAATLKLDQITDLIQTLGLGQLEGYGEGFDAGENLQAAACTWMKANPNVWSGWIPTPRCNKGHVYDATSHICAACTNNTYADEEGSEVCKSCTENFGAGYTSPDGIRCNPPPVQSPESVFDAVGMVILSVTMVTLW